MENRPESSSKRVAVSDRSYRGPLDPDLCNPPSLNHDLGSLADQLSASTICDSYKVTPVSINAPPAETAQAVLHEILAERRQHAAALEQAHALFAARRWSELNALLNNTQLKAKKLCRPELLAAAAASGDKSVLVWLAFHKVPDDYIRERAGYLLQSLSDATPENSTLL